MSQPVPISKPVPNRIYIDSSVLIHWYSGDSSSSAFNSAYSFLKDVSKGKYEGLVSLLAIKEVIKFIRNVFVKKGQSSPASWIADEKRFIDRISRFSGIKIIEGRPDERKGLSVDPMIFGSVSKDALSILMNHGGKSKFNVVTGKPEHDGIHPMDALHIVLAKKMGCSKIATFDMDFMDTKDEVEPMLLSQIPDGV
jgi:predicted nucleic acid-binding protein